ncbi:MAG TPA: phosphoribosylanthranilate isomerase [Pyrinomonadaceae bacterium]|nr:phosphoribosylanthranilate isomerase [Pyrinomonadaceae bacterium]
MTKVKICGITNREDALLSAKFGADALGFNFYEKSPRYIAPEKAREIIEQLPPEILKIGVFVNESLEKICETAETARLDGVQLHGEETPAFAREIKARTNLEIIKAFRVSPEFKPEDVLQYETDAVLLDAYSRHEHGGTGETFDWEIAKKVREIFPKMYLAGGLSAKNVIGAVEKVKPFAVDSCSALEKEKGKKDKLKTIRFIEYSKKRNYLIIQNIYDVLFHIEIMPESYLGKKSLSLLASYLHGFHEGVILSQGNFDTKQLLHEQFNAFIQQKLISDSKGNGWLRDILDKTGGDEEKAFDLFFALLEEFKLEKEDLSNE